MAATFAILSLWSLILRMRTQTLQTVSYIIDASLTEMSCHSIKHEKSPRPRLTPLCILPDVQLSQQCPPDRTLLMGQKTCLLMVVAASLELCRKSVFSSQVCRPPAPFLCFISYILHALSLSLLAFPHGWKCTESGGEER